MTGIRSANPFDAFLQIMSPWMTTGAAFHDSFSQSILPGWSLISVNQGNSSAPDTEQAIVAKASYGRQLGRIMDALDVLIRSVNPTLSGADEKAVTAFNTLFDEVAQAKADAAAARIERLRADLTSLRTNNTDEFARQMAALIAVVDDYKASTDAR